jgi:hypothetical protein
MKKKLLDFKASLSDIKQVSPLFSACKVRVLYTGKNRNMSIITKDAVEKALPSLIGVPIVGEFSTENEDYKGHGGAIDLKDYKYIHTTKPYGFIPESAQFEWELVRGADGASREYLTVDGLLWTGRYEEAFTVIENSKGQSMEIEVTDGVWNDSEEAYQINNFLFSALCILGDNVTPAFEDANITAYSLDRDTFRKEFSLMMNDFKKSLLFTEKEDNTMLQKLLEKYSITIEDIQAKVANYETLSDEELELEVNKAFDNDEDSKVDEVDEKLDEANEKGVADDASRETPNSEVETKQNEIDKEKNADNLDQYGEEIGQSLIGINDDYKPEDADSQKEAKGNEDFSKDDEKDSEKEEEAIKSSDDKEGYKYTQEQYDTLLAEVEELRLFKLEVEKANHESKVKELFVSFKLTEEDVENLDVHKFSLDEIEEKCYAILGRKTASKKEFSKQSNDKGNIRLPLGGESNQEKAPSKYGDLFEKYEDQ